ncbi:MAG: hypothetical protein ACXWW7_11650 [Nocardioides sp.]
MFTHSNEYLVRAIIEDRLARALRQRRAAEAVRLARARHIGRSGATGAGLLG